MNILFIVMGLLKKFSLFHVFNFFIFYYNLYAIFQNFEAYYCLAIKFKLSLRTTTKNKTQIYRMFLTDDVLM